MDRPIVYTGALPQTADVLNLGKMGMVGLAWALRGILGSGTYVHNLPCNPTTPASLQVTVGAGAIYSMDTVDATSYSDLGLDTHTNLKQGILNDPVTLTITPPGTSGFSQVYLVEAILSDIDNVPVVLPYFNATNPSQPFSGPANSGQSQNTVRSVQCTIALKAGTAAATGSQTTPAPDTGYTGLYAITVANGQTQITSTNIVLQTSAPFFPTLPSVPNDVQTNLWTYAVDTGVVNAMAATVYPPLTSLVVGTGVLIKVAFGNTGAATFNLNGLGAQPIHRANGSALASGDVNAGELMAMVWDGAAWQVLNFFGFTASTTNNNTFNVNIPYAVDTGAVNAMSGNFSPPVTSLAAGLTVEIQVAVTNTGDSTLVCNGLAAKGIRQNGSVLNPRALVAGQIVLMVYDGTFFQIINARWPYISFDISAAPGTDISLVVGDQCNVTFTNTLFVPLKVAAVPGMYQIDVVLTANNAHDTELVLMPNNNIYLSGTFISWNVTNAGMSPAPYANNQALSAEVFASLTGYQGVFLCDCYFDNEAGEGVNYSSFGASAPNSGPSVFTMLISTFTAAKQVRFYGGINGGPFMGFSRWFDTSTVWSSLGTFGVSDGFIPPGQTSIGTVLSNTSLNLGQNGAAASISGTAVIKRLA